MSDVQLSEAIRRLLGQKPDEEFMAETDESTISSIRDGQDVRVYDLIAKKICMWAADPKKANQWAVEMVMDRMEGKPGRGAPPKEDGRELDDKLDEITVEKLNQIAASESTEESGNARSSREGSNTSERADRPASRLLDLPAHKPDSPEETGRKSTLA